MKRTLLGSGLCVIGLCASALFGQDATRAPRTVQTTEKSQVHTPSQQPAELAKIFGNLGSPTDTYNDTNGAIIAGPGSILSIGIFPAAPFTPKRNAHVSVIEVPIQYLDGANQVNLSLYSDASGMPGKVLAGPQPLKNLPDFGTCCELGVWKLTTSVEVTAGTQYWIVVDTPSSGTGDDFEGVWDYIFPTPFLQASNTDGQGWVAYGGGEELPAAAVFGTIP
jgi:hypothetical protein